MKIFLIIIFSILLQPKFLFAQKTNIDSLVTISQNSTSAINKIDAFFKLSKIYKYDSTTIAEKYAAEALTIAESIYNDTLIVNSINGLCPIRILQNNFDNVLALYIKAIELSDKVNFEKGKGITYNNIGTYYNKKNNLDSAVFFYLKAADIFEKLNKLKVAASTYNNAGIIYYKKANYEKALEYFIKSLKLKESILANGKRVATDGELAASMVNIGLFYFKLEQYKEAIAYLKKAKKKALVAQNNNYTCIAETNLGVLYARLQKYDSALYFNNNALILAEKMKNIQRASSIYTGIANIYTKTEKFDLAIVFFLKSLEIKNKLNDVRGQALVEKHISKLYLIQKKYKLAKEHGLLALETSKNTKNIELEKDTYKLLAKIDKSLYNYKSALDFIESFNILNDSINSLNNKKIIADMQTKYETEKKTVEIKELKIKDIESQNIEKVFLLIIISLFAITILLIIFFRQKQKTNRILNDKNEELKKLNTTQNRLMSIISHDLKAPLSAFYSITKSLQTKIKIISEEQADNYFNRMLNSSLGLKLQLENMLNWSIAQSSEIIVVKSKINISILLLKVIMILDEFAKERAIKLENIIDEDIEINTDGRLLSIVLNNLITNAIKFSEDNSNVKISAIKKSKKIILAVSDYGIGISNADLQNLFTDKGNSSKHKNKGTGLGLIVSNDIIKKLNGRIWAESTENIGTTFYIEL